MKITMKHRETLCHFAITDKGETFPEDLFERDKTYMDRRTKRIINLVKAGYLKSEFVSAPNNKRNNIRINITEKGYKEIQK